MHLLAKLAVGALGLAGVAVIAIGVGLAADLSIVRHAPAGDVPTTVPTVAGPRGLEVTQRGYQLRLSAPTAPYGPGRLRFQLLGPDRRPTPSGRPSEVHMFLVQRDLSGFQHVHPVRDGDGTWSAPVDLRAGTYRVLTEFQPAGDPTPLTLGADLIVSGSVRPGLLPEPAKDFLLEDCSVSIKGALTTGTVSRVSFDVHRRGQRLIDPTPYLGPADHLVILRAGDLAVLDVRRVGTGLTFEAAVSAPGTYRLFLDFTKGAVARTAEYTAVVV